MNNRIPPGHPVTPLVWFSALIIGLLLLALSVWHGIDPQGYERLNGTQATQVVNYAR